MFSLRKPVDVAIDRLLNDSHCAEFSYPQVGDSRACQAPADTTINHHRVAVGRGEAAYRAACDVLRTWQYVPSWVRFYGGEQPPAEGRSVASLVRVWGVWVVSQCRVFYIIDEPRRFGFGYGTLHGHPLHGEERFLLEWDPNDDDVWFEIWSFSKPATWLARLGRPIVRKLQSRFVQDAGEVMRDFVNETINSDADRT